MIDNDQQRDHTEEAYNAALLHDEDEPTLRELHDRASEQWRRSYRAADVAQELTVHMIAQVLRERWPSAATLVLTPDGDRPDHYEPGNLYDVNGALLAEDDETWDVAGADHSTNDVLAMVGDLEDDRDWRVFAPENKYSQRHLDIPQVLAAALPDPLL